MSREGHSPLLRSVSHEQQGCEDAHSASMDPRRRRQEGVAQQIRSQEERGKMAKSDSESEHHDHDKLGLKRFKGPP